MRAALFFVIIEENGGKDVAMPSNKLSVLLLRGLRQRCPVCGRGKIFSGIFQTYEHCLVCQFGFEREPGYYTGAIALNLAITELLIAAIAVPLAASETLSILALVLLGLVLTVLVPLLLYRPTKSLWMAVDHFLHPVAEERS